jgi:hypothetical protein
MSSENPVADRLLTDARRKTARQSSPMLARAALIVGVIAVLASPISIAGWILGSIALGLGIAAAQRTVGSTQAKIAIVLGLAAIFIGVFFYTLTIALT